MKKQLLSLIFATSLSFGIANAQTVKAGLYFDGTDDSFVVPHFSGLNLGTGAFTIEAWVRVDTNNSYNPHIIHKKDTAVNATGFALAISDKGKVNAEIAGNAYSTGFGGFSGANLKDGTCHHIAFHRDVSGTADTVRIFIDGKLSNKSVKAIISADVSYSGDMHVGWTSGGFGKEDWPFKGMIKEIRIWNVARTETQIDANMDEFLKGNEAGLVGYWRINDNSGTTVKDYGPSKKNGTLKSGSNAPKWQDFCDVINGTLPSGIAEVEATEVSAYPNPVSQVLYFNIPEGNQIEILRIYNSLGTLVRVENTPAKSFDVSELKAGIYFYEMLMENNTVVTNRFIKQ